MPKRLCLIGNSHLAAIKLGWSDIGASYPEYEPTFFGAPGPGSAFAVRLEGDAIVTETAAMTGHFRFTSGGKDRIALADYDAFALFSLSFNIHVVVEQIREFRPDIFRALPGKHFISEKVFRELVRSSYENSTAYKLARTIAGVTGNPIVISPQPLPSERLGERPGTWAQLKNNGYGESLRGLCAEVARDLCGDRAEVVWQPAHTVRDSLFTGHEFSEGSVRLKRGFDDPHPEADFDHMNGKYGAAVLTDLLDHGHL